MKWLKLRIWTISGPGPPKIPLDSFDQTYYQFGYNASLRPALPEGAAGFFVPAPMGRADYQMLRSGGLRTSSYYSLLSSLIAGNSVLECSQSYILYDAFRDRLRHGGAHPM